MQKLIIGIGLLAAVLPYIALWLKKQFSVQYRIVKVDYPYFGVQYKIQYEQLNGWMDCHSFTKEGNPYPVYFKNYEDAINALFKTVKDKNIKSFYIIGWGFKNFHKLN